MGDDLALLIDAGSCTISLDVLRGTALIDDRPAKLHIAEEICAWFKSRLEELKIPAENIVAANLKINQTLKLEETRSKKVAHFDFDCKSMIETDEKTYEGLLAESHSWHQRKIAK